MYNKSRNTGHKFREIDFGLSTSFGLEATCLSKHLISAAQRKLIRHIKMQKDVREKYDGRINS
jgi:hypothetical protein